MDSFFNFNLLSLEFKTSSGRTLLIADPHMGFEISRGIRIRTHFEDMLGKFIEDVDPDLLVILGDLKEPLGLNFSVKKILFRFFSALKTIPIFIVQGNHDGRIRDVTENFPNVEVRKYFLIDGNLFLHGHTKLPPIKFKKAFLGHAHPAFTLSSEKIKKKVKVFARIGPYLILPTINPYMEGFNIKVGLELVPFLKDKREIDVFLPEGIYLGRIRR